MRKLICDDVYLLAKWLKKGDKISENKWFTKKDNDIYVCEGDIDVRDFDSSTDEDSSYIIVDDDGIIVNICIIIPKNQPEKRMIRTVHKNGNERFCEWYTIIREDIASLLFEEEKYLNNINSGDVKCYKIVSSEYLICKYTSLIPVVKSFNIICEFKDIREIINETYINNEIMKGLLTIYDPDEFTNEELDRMINKIYKYYPSFKQYFTKEIITNILTESKKGEDMI